MGTTEITAWDPPNQHGLNQIGGPVPFESTTKLESKGNGTQLNVYITGEVSGWLKLLLGLFIKQMVKQMDTNFQALKLLLEEGEL